MTIINGTVNADRLMGTVKNDLISGLAGDDTLDGKEGNDFLFGGDGDDTLDGKEGNDFLFGGNGNDNLFGGENNDFLFGGNGNDFLEGNSGNDFVVGGKGNDTINGVGDRFINSGDIGAGTIDTLTGGAGSDLFILNTVIVGIAGNDSFPLYNAQGESDYALITDFNPKFDSIELAGQPEEYRLEFLSSKEVSDAQLIYQPSASTEGDLIAILENVPSALDLNDAAFIYVPDFRVFEIESIEN